MPSAPASCRATCGALLACRLHSQCTLALTHPFFSSQPNRLKFSFVVFLLVLTSYSLSLPPPLLDSIPPPSSHLDAAPCQALGFSLVLFVSPRSTLPSSLELVLSHTVHSPHLHAPILSFFQVLCCISFLSLNGRQRGICIRPFLPVINQPV